MRSICDQHSKGVPGCRPCRLRRSAWSYDRKQRILAGTWRPRADYVNPELVKRHLAKLIKAGMSYREISRQTRQVDPQGRGTSCDTVRRLAQGKRPTTHVRTGALILKVAIPKTVVPTPDQRWEPQWVPSHGAQRRIEALQWMRWPHRVVLQMALGWSETSCPRKYKTRITPRTHKAIAEFYEKHSHEWGPCVRVGKLARTRGYAPPAAWDEDTIDDPKARPYGLIKRESA